MKRIIIAAALFAFAAPAAFAQEYGFKKGDTQFTLSGTGSNDRDFDTGGIGASAGLSWFLTDGWEVGVRQDFNFADTGARDTWNGTTRAAVDYNFDLGRFRPFVGASIGYIYGDGVNETGIIGPEAGLKYFVNPTTFIYGQTSYQYLFEDSNDLSDNFDNAVWLHNIGIGFKF